MTEPMRELLEAVDDVRRRLDADSLEPDAARTDWPNQRVDIEAVDRATRTVVTELDRAVEHLDGDDRAAIESRVGFLLGRVAALFLVSRFRDPRSLLLDARRLTYDAPLILAALEEPDRHAALVHGQWLMRNGHEARAVKVLAGVERAAKSPVLRDAARVSGDAPRPVTSAPQLWTLNSFGVRLYGARDRWEDGTHVATLCICALFIPIFPLTAYRVFDYGNGSYGFVAKHRLSRFARAARWFLVAAVAAGISVSFVSSYLSSPHRLARVAFADARAEQGAAAVAAYERALDRYGLLAPEEMAQEAGLVLARAYVAEVPSPLRLGDVRLAEAALNRFRALAPRVRSSEAAGVVVAAAERWVEELGGATDEHTRAGLNVLELASSVGGREHFQRIDATARAMRRTMAARAEAAWPLEALELYLGSTDPDAVKAAGALLAKIAERPLLLASVRERALLWLAAGREAAPTEASAIEAALADAEAKTSDDARAELLAEPTGAELVKHLKRAPWDDEAAARRAELDLERGQAAEAERRLAAFGAPGWLAPTAQQTYASIFVATDRLPEAEVILAHLLVARAARYREASQRWGERAEALENDLIRRLQNGTIPLELRKKLDHADEKTVVKLGGDWIRGELSSDAELQRRTKTVKALADVVPTSLMLGSVLLRQANAARGDARTELLSRAERAYLTVREDAAGIPSYHIGLGQVFHRLGRHEEGERELSEVLVDASPEITLEVASVYRNLGLLTRAKEVATGVYQHGAEKVRHRAALMLAVMSATEEDQETWLERSDPDSPEIQVRLRDLRGHRARREGRCEEAERELTAVSDYYEQAAEYESAAANNGALVYGSRFDCTGDVGHVRRAVDLLERATRMSPESSIVAGNLADHLAHRARLEVLSRWIAIDVARPSAQESSWLVAALVEGPLREEILAALKDSASYRRWRSVTAQRQVLAPGDVDSYADTLEAIEDARDLDALRDLAARVEHTRIDRSESEEQLEAVARGDRDEKIRAWSEHALARYEARLATAKARGDARTQAALSYLAARALEDGLAVDTKGEDARAARDRLDAVHALWPDGGLGGRREWMAFVHAVVEARQDSKALADRWDAEVRVQGVAQVVSRALEDDADGEVHRALAARPEIAQAIELRASRTSATPQFHDTLLADITKSPELERASQAYYADTFERELVELEAKIFAGPSFVYRASLFAKHGGSSGR